LRGRDGLGSARVSRAGFGVAPKRTSDECAPDMRIRAWARQ
jgi:hypothetical protein